LNPTLFVFEKQGRT